MTDPVKKTIGPGLYRWVQHRVKLNQTEGKKKMRSHVMKRKQMKMLTGVIGTVLCQMTLHAGLIKFEDDFNRANVASTSDGVLIGDGYVISAGTVQLSGGSISGVTGSSNALMYYNKIVLSHEFTVAADVSYALGSTRYAGVVFNYQDKDNYYFARILGADFQVRRVVNGSAAGGVLLVAKDVVAEGTNYRLTVTSGSAYKFDISLVGGTTDKTWEVTDGGSNFTGGYAGIITSAANNTVIENFYIETIREPATVGSFFISKSREKS